MTGETWEGGGGGWERNKTKRKWWEDDVTGFRLVHGGVNETLPLPDRKRRRKFQFSRGTTRIVLQSKRGVHSAHLSRLQDSWSRAPTIKGPAQTRSGHKTQWKCLFNVSTRRGGIFAENGWGHKLKGFGFFFFFFCTRPAGHVTRLEWSVYGPQDTQGILGSNLHVTGDLSNVIQI